MKRYIFALMAASILLSIAVAAVATPPVDPNGLIKFKETWDCYPTSHAAMDPDCADVWQSPLYGGGSSGWTDNQGGDDWGKIAVVGDPMDSAYGYGSTFRGLSEHYDEAKTDPNSYSLKRFNGNTYDWAYIPAGFSPPGGYEGYTNRANYAALAMNTNSTDVYVENKGWTNVGPKARIDYLMCVENSQTTQGKGLTVFFNTIAGTGKVEFTCPSVGTAMQFRVYGLEGYGVDNSWHASNTSPVTSWGYGMAFLVDVDGAAGTITAGHRALSDPGYDLRNCGQLSVGAGLITSVTGMRIGHIGAVARAGSSGKTWVENVWVTVPEPGSMAAMATGLVGLLGFAVRRKRS